MSIWLLSTERLSWGISLQGLPHSHSSSQALAMLCERAGIPETLRGLYARLMIVPPDTPLPMTLRKRLWNLDAEDKAEATANLFESKVCSSSTSPQRIARLLLGVHYCCA